MFKKIMEWWKGELMEWGSPSGGGIFFRKHWTSNLAHMLVNFYVVHWKWLWVFGATLLGIYVAYLG